MAIHRVGFGPAADVRVAQAGMGGSWSRQAVASVAHGADAGAVVTVAPDTPWREADDRARSLGVRHLFVVDSSKLVGVLCRCDLYPEPDEHEGVASRMASQVYVLDRRRRSAKRRRR